MKLATHCFAAFVAALTLVPSAFGLGNGPKYDPTKNMLFPAGEKSQGLYSVLNNSGEFGVSARAQKKGGKLKKIRDLEVSVPGVAGLGRLKAVGEGSLVKVGSSSPQIKETLNMVPAADGQTMQFFLRNKKGRVLGKKSQVSIGGQFWFETFSAIKNRESDLKKGGPIQPVYNGGNGAQQPRGTAVSTYVQLSEEIFSPLRELTLAQLKAVVLAFNAYNSATNEGLDPEERIALFFGGLSTIANGSLNPLLLTNPIDVPGLTQKFLSTDPEVLGLALATLQEVISKITAGGAVDFNALVENLQELIDIPVKQITQDFQFIVEYSWPLDQRDLDTGTTFLGQTVGFDYLDDAPFLHWDGDETDVGETEKVTIDLNGAIQAGALPSRFTVTCRAGWFTPSEGSGPATLHVFLENVRTGERFGEVTREILPGSQEGQATTLVGSASFEYSPDTNVLRFTIDQGT